MAKLTMYQQCYKMYNIFYTYCAVLQNIDFEYYILDKFHT